MKFERKTENATHFEKRYSRIPVTRSLTGGPFERYLQFHCINLLAGVRGRLRL